MKNCNAPENQTTRRILPIACATALAVAFTVSLPQPAHAGESHRHPCPPTFRCQRGTRRSSWVTPSAPRTTSACPQALASSSYSSRRRPPCSATTISKSSPTTSAPTRLRVARFAPRGSTPGTRAPSGAKVDPDNSSSDPDFVAPGAIAWLLLQVVGAQDGPDGGDTLTATTFIQRLNTSGGVAPSTGCTSSTDVGHQAFVPYTADYFFYTNQ